MKTPAPQTTPSNLATAPRPAPHCANLRPGLRQHCANAVFPRATCCATPAPNTAPHCAKHCAKNATTLTGGVVAWTASEVAQ